MKILYLSFDTGIPYWGTKGASIHIREFTRALKVSGHQVDTWAAKLGDPPATGIDVWELPIPKADFLHSQRGEGDAKLLVEAGAFARNFMPGVPSAEKYDLVYERYSLFGIRGLTLARQHGIPFVLEVNSPLLEEEKDHRKLVLEPLTRAIEEYLFSQADQVVAVSQTVLEYVRSVAPGSRVMVLPNGVDVAPFSDAAIPFSPAKAREDFTVGFIGSMKPWHGLEKLMQAFNILRDEERINLVFVGEGPQRTALEEEAKRLNLSHRVLFTGAVAYQDIPKMLSDMDVLVAPYPDLKDFYFSPIKIFEYMASGRPIVASNVGQVAEILKNEATALLVPPGDPEALASALMRLERNRELGTKLGSNAQQEARSCHTWAMRVKTMESVFDTLVAQNRTGRQLAA